MEAENETGKVVQAVSVQADSEGEGEALVTHKLIPSASQTQHTRGIHTTTAALFTVRTQHKLHQKPVSNHKTLLEVKARNYLVERQHVNMTEQQNPAEDPKSLRIIS